MSRLLSVGAKVRISSLGFGNETNLWIDNNIYIWRASTGQLIDRLEGHDSCVNCVSWNPVIPGIFASASDDGTVKV
jgi:WD40 repeat protein